MTTSAADVRIEPWAEDDLDLLRLINTEEMRKHVGGPEGPDALLVRHRRYLEFPGLGTGQMFRIVTDQGRTKAGSVGYYSRRWHGEQVFEMGWNVLPVPGARHRRRSGPAGRRARGGHQAAHLAARVPLGRQPGLQRGLPPGRLHPGGRDRVRVPARPLHAQQRLAHQPHRVGHQLTVIQT